MYNIIIYYIHNTYYAKKNKNAANNGDTFVKKLTFWQQRISSRIKLC